MKHKIVFALLLAYGCGSAKHIPESMPAEWDSTSKNWLEFEKCVGDEPTDYKCDSCYRAIVGRFPKP